MMFTRVTNRFFVTAQCLYHKLIGTVITATAGSNLLFSSQVKDLWAVTNIILIMRHVFTSLYLLSSKRRLSRQCLIPVTSMSSMTRAGLALFITVNKCQIRMCETQSSAMRLMWTASGASHSRVGGQFRHQRFWKRYSLWAHFLFMYLGKTGNKPSNTLIVAHDVNVTNKFA